MKKSVYQRPNKPARKGVYKRERVPDRAPFQAPPLLEVHRSTECHVTPTDVAARMVEYLEPERTDLICEPQAGTGNLIAALLDYGISIKNINAVEKNQELYQLLVQRFPGGLNLYSGCFLDYAALMSRRIRCTRVITNPPFKEVRKHMDAAVDLLGCGNGGRSILVGLVPITYQHPLAETLEELPITTFPSAAVHTKLIKMELIG